MKRVTILRHAKSSWEESGLDDFNRPLNQRGRKAARRLGRELTRRDMRFDLVVSSMAARARETLYGVGEKFDFDAEVRFEPRMYLASDEVLLALVRELPEWAQAPLLVGHNPGLERLLVELTHHDPDGLRDRVARRFPTGALAAIELPANRWIEVGPGSGELVELILPKEPD